MTLNYAKKDLQFHCGKWLHIDFYCLTLLMHAHQNISFFFHSQMFLFHTPSRKMAVLFIKVTNLPTANPKQFFSPYTLDVIWDYLEARLRNCYFILLEYIFYLTFSYLLTYCTNYYIVCSHRTAVFWCWKETSRVSRTACPNHKTSAEIERGKKRSWWVFKITCITMLCVC